MSDPAVESTEGQDHEELNLILEGAPSELEVTADAGAKGDTAEPESPPEAEAAPPAAEEEKTDEPEPKDEFDPEKPETWRLAAIQDERAKRQKLAAQLSQAQEQQAQLQHIIANLTQGQQAEPPQPTPEDLESQFYTKPVDFIQQAVGNQVDSIKQHFAQQMAQQQQALMSQKLAMADEMGRARYEDYDDTVALFTDAASSDRSLWDKAMSDANPGTFAYRYGKALRLAQDTGGDPDKLRAKIREEVIEELREKGALETALAVPKTTAGTRSARGRSEPAVEPDSLDSIIGRIH